MGFACLQIIVMASVADDPIKAQGDSFDLNALIFLFAITAPEKCSS